MKIFDIILDSGIAMIIIAVMWYIVDLLCGTGATFELPPELYALVSPVFIILFVVIILTAIMVAMKSVRGKSSE